MANWQRRLEITDIWNRARSGEITIQKLAEGIVTRLKALEVFKDEDVNDDLQNIIDEFEGLSTDTDAGRQDFDSVMESLYDWADTKLDDNWPPKKVCWIQVN